MNQAGDEMVPIPKDLVKALQSDMEMAMSEKLEKRLKQAGIHHPHFHVGEIFAVRGIRFEVYEIGPGGMSIRPIGRAEPGDERTDQESPPSGLYPG